MDHTGNNHKEKVIEVNGLGVSFDGHQVLTGLSFTAYKGEVTVILGSSGCGKSTVLKHLLGLYPLLEGEITILGRDLRTLTEEQQLELYLVMGVFYQEGALINSLSVAENVALPLQQHTSLPDDLIMDIVRMKLGLVNLEHAMHLYPSELSGGMLKRAALARAIVMDPPIMFCDEPGAGLDPVSLESLDRLIINLKELLGMSILIVTHEVSSVMRIADRIVYLEGGVTLFEGSVDDALKCGIASVERFFSVILKSGKVAG